MKHSLFILPLLLTLSSLISPQAVNARPQNKSVAERNTPIASTTERNKALVLKWSDALRNNDMATAQALVTDDWVIHGAGSNFSRGPEGLKQWHAYIDARWIVSHWAERAEEDIFAEGDKVVRRGPVYRTSKANNKESAMTVVFIYRIAGDKITEVWRVADALSSYQQIGAQVILPGTNENAGQAISLPAKPGKVAVQKSSSEPKTSQSAMAPRDKSIAKSEIATESPTEHNKALVARWAQAIGNKDLAVAQALVTDDCVVHAGGFNYPRGPEGIEQWQDALGSNWSYWGSTTDDIVAEGDKVARRTTVFAMYKPNHRGTVTSVIFIYRIADGKIAEVWRVANYVSTYLQAGAQIIIPGEAERSVKKTEAEQEVLKVKQEFDEAALRNDADGRARFYGDDYAIIYGDGTLGDKAEQLKRVRSGRLRYSARTAEDVVVRVYGETAVIIERRKQTATFDGRPRPSDVWASELWVKREGAWRLVSTQITPIQAPISGPLLPGRVAEQSPRTASSATEPMRAETRAEIQNGAGQAEQEVLKARQELDDATRRNDADALARVYADDFLFVGYAGFLTNKEYQLEAFRSGFMRTTARAAEDVIVRVYGDTAVTITRRKQTGTVGGRTPPGVGIVRVTGVWVKRQGQWQLVSSQVTPILEGDADRSQG